MAKKTKSIIIEEINKTMKGLYDANIIKNVRMGKMIKGKKK